MKLFARHKTLDEVKRQCRKQRLKLDTTHYRLGSDYVKVEGGGAVCYYSTVNGRFFGKTPQGVEFQSDSHTHDREPWFEALLKFFYVEKGGAA